MSAKDVFRPGRCVVLAWAIFYAPNCLGQVAVSSSDTAEYDCGTLALHTLLTIEGRPTPIDALQSRLPSGPQEGHSMAELRDAAGAFGLTLIGVSLPRSDRAPDRPALVLVKWKQHSHFIVIRPVGHSGKLLQIIDTARDPIVVDAADVYAAPEWTGLALIPRRTSWAFPIALGLCVACCSVCALRLVVRRSRPEARNPPRLFSHSS